MLGRPALFLAGPALFRWAICDQVPARHVVGAALLGLVSLASPWLPPAGLIAAATGVLLAVAVWEKVFARAPVSHADIALAR